MYFSERHFYLLSFLLFSSIFFDSKGYLRYNLCIIHIYLLFFNYNITWGDIMTISTRAKGILLAVVGSIFWGGSGVAAEFLLQDRGMTPQYLTSIRTLVAGILLLSIDYFINKQNITNIWKERTSRWRLIAFGIVGMMMVQYTYFVAIQYCNAPTATIIQYLMPIIVLVWVSCSTHKMPTVMQILCCILAIFGTAVLVTHGSITTLAISETALIWGLASAFAAAFYTVYPRWLLMRYSSAQVIGWAMLIGSVAISAIYPPLEYPGTLDTAAALNLAYICVLGTAISFWMYISSTKYILAQEASILNATEPLASIVFSVILLGTLFELPEIIGTVLIIIPIIYITLKKH